MLRRPFAFVFTAIVACSATEVAPRKAPAAQVEEPSEPKSPRPKPEVSVPTATTTEGASADAGDGGDAGAQEPTWCEAFAGKMDRCDGERMCGTSFAAWCALHSKTNSRLYEVADTRCVASTCSGDKRADCRFRQYREADLSSSQRALLAAYCSTCGGDRTSERCARETITYDPEKPDAITDAFIAVWELSDAITDGIREQCTGAIALRDAEAGTSAEACAKAFGQCAGDVYLNALPECP